MCNEVLLSDAESIAFICAGRSDEKQSVDHGTASAAYSLIIMRLISLQLICIINKVVNYN